MQLPAFCMRVFFDDYRSGRKEKGWVIANIRRNVSVRGSQDGGGREHCSLSGPGRPAADGASGDTLGREKVGSTVRRQGSGGNV